MSPLDKFNKIKTLFNQLKVDYDILFKSNTDKATELERINNLVDEI
ncbi:hypothetical protein JIY74_33300 [Vibrio harveyi]|nr:hypothetical protein [Vibrio harveyi]